MKWDEDDENDYRIVDAGDWYSLDDLGEAPDRAGVYIFADRGTHVKYIGKAGAGRLRNEMRNAIYIGKSRGATI